MIEKRTKQEFAYVIDASAIVKLFSDEPGTLNARRLFRACQAQKVRLFAPDILLYEVGNALGKGKKLSANDVAEGVYLLLHSSLELVALNFSLVHYASTFMEQYGITFYDAVYGAVAYARKIPLVSADLKDHQKIQEIAVRHISAV